MKVVFYGTPDFSVGCLDRISREHEVVAVVTQPDRPANRGEVKFSPVKARALELGIPVLQPEKIRAQLDTVFQYPADIGVTAAYGQILPQALLDFYPHGIINVHASILPKYRGSSPIQWAIINGERETGITIMQTELGVDTGAILGVVKTPVSVAETAETLFFRLSELAPDLLSKTLTAIESGTVVAVEQDHSEATHCKMLTKETGHLDFSQSAQALERLIRAVTPWPGAFAFRNGERIKIHSASVVSGGEGESGTVIGADKDGIFVACGEGALRIDALQAAGGKVLTAREFLCGHRIAVGEKLC